MKKIKSFLGVTVLMLFFSAFVQAEVVTYTDTVTGSSPGIAGKTILFSIPKFNPVMGTLKGIKVTMSGEQSSNLRVTSIDGSDGMVKASLSGYISVISDGVTLDTRDYLFQNPSYPNYDPTQDGVYAISWSATIDSVVKSYGPSDTEFSDFIGATGNAPVSAYAKFTSLLQLWVTGIEYDSAWRTPYTFTAEIEYTYENETLISLASFTATAKAGEATIEWTTDSEINNAGFNIYRATSADGDYVKINETLIPAAGSPTEGSTYTFNDAGLKNRKTYYYKLEDIDLNGSSTMHGPVSAMPRLIHAFE